MKNKYVFEGRVIPERVDANFPLVDIGGMRLQICKSKIFVLAEVEAANVPTLRNSLLTLVGSVVNYIGFLSTTAMSYEIDSIINVSTGEVAVFGADGFAYDNVDKIVEEQCRFQKEKPGTQVILDMNLVLNPIVSRATFELRSAIRYPDFTAMHCQFAIESIRNHFCDDFDKRDWEKNAWKKMRKSLNISEECLRSFHNIATDQRHGKNRQQTWSQRQVCMQISWEVLHRFICFLGNDKTPLSKRDYPELTLKWGDAS